MGLKIARTTDLYAKEIPRKGEAGYYLIVAADAKGLRKPGDQNPGEMDQILLE